MTPPGAAEGCRSSPGAGYVVSADRYISIGVRVAGRIDRYLVEEGTRVSAGDPLVQLDAREYRATVERAAANLKLAQAEAVLAKQKRVARRRCSAPASCHARSSTSGGPRRTRPPPGSGTAKADLDAARVALEYTTLRAPRSGVILAKLKEVGEIAVPGGFSGSGDLIRMANLDDLRGQVDVTEASWPRSAWASAPR